jgi:hypothetical protein
MDSDAGFLENTNDSADIESIINWLTVENRIVNIYSRFQFDIFRVQ